MSKKEIDLDQDEFGTFSLNHLEEDFDLNLPDIPSMDMSGIQEQLEKQAQALTEAQIKALKTAQAVQLVGAQVKALNEVTNMHVQIKEKEPNNHNFIRIKVTPSGVYSDQVTPILKIRTHSIDINWD